MCYDMPHHIGRLFHMRLRLTPEVLSSIRVDREDHGLTLTEIAMKYELSSSTVQKAISEMDSSKVQKASPSRRVLPPTERPSRPSLSKGNLGEAGRQMIAARLMLAGLHVFRPLMEDTPVDLLVLRMDGQALKCQCKCFYVTQAGKHVMNLTSTRKWGPNSKAVKHRYTRDEVDFFLGYAIDTDVVYVFPFEAVSNLKDSVGIWLLREPVGKNNFEFLDPTPFANAFHLMSP